jgi:4-hydroxy-3-polyprenylbenzoate decarboxylase
MIVIAVKQRFSGHAKQALMAASGLKGSRSMSSYFVTVDDDVDPSNIRDVIWAICTRGDPAQTVDIVRSSWTEDLDPRLSPRQKNQGDYTMGRVLIDACKPFHWRESFPRTNIFSPDEKERVKEKWTALIQRFERPLSPVT